MVKLQQNVKKNYLEMYLFHNVNTKVEVALLPQPESIEHKT